MPPEAPRKMRLYRFMAARWALKSIETREIRIGRLVELNDPFEFVPGIEGLRDDAPKGFVREQQMMAPQDLNSKIGLLCFTSTCREPTLWSHYAECHRGIALGFDIAPNFLVLEKVEYPDPPKRPTMHPGNPNPADWMEFVRRTIITKALGWKVESEYRVLISFACSPCRFDNGHYFLPMTHDSLVLTDVILGCRCSLDENYVKQTLEQNDFKNVRVVRAKLSIDTFEVEC